MTTHEMIVTYGVIAVCWAAFTLSCFFFAKDRSVEKQLVFFFWWSPLWPALIVAMMIGSLLDFWRSSHD